MAKESELGLGLRVTPASLIREVTDQGLDENVVYLKRGLLQDRLVFLSSCVRNALVHLSCQMLTSIPWM